MDTIDAVLFDLDGTLCRDDQDYEAVYRGAFEAVAADPFGSPADLWAAVDGPPDPDDAASHYAGGFARVAAQHGRQDVDADALGRGLVDAIDHAAVSLLPGARAAIDRARTHGHVGLLTNGPEHRQSVKLESLGIEEAFDLIVYAGDMPRRKPHPDPFDRALDELGVDADRALYVGNSLEYDVAGAQGAGLRVAWYPDGAPDPGENRPEYVVESLHDLCDVLDATDGSPAPEERRDPSGPGSTAVR